MDLFLIIPSILFSLFSSAVLSYIAMSTMVGPWIAPVLVLIGGLILRFRKIHESQGKINQDIALMQTAGSVGGLIAVGIGFTLPTLFFLDPVSFNNWIKNPFYFCGFIAISCLIAGGLGLWLARVWADKLINQEKLSFPVGDLIYETISSQSQYKQAKSMLAGFLSTLGICFLRDGFLKFKGFIPQAIYFFQGFAGKEIVIAIWPTVWAVGFIVGIKIVSPLFVGMLSRYIIVYPLNSIPLFSMINKETFLMAFCSGLVVAEFVLGNLKYPVILFKKIKEGISAGFLFSIKDQINKIFKFLKLDKLHSNKGNFSSKNFIIKYKEPIVLFSLSFIFLYVLGFMPLAQILFLGLTLLFTYQISLLGGKVGLVPFGRFATFIMIPMMILFKLNYFQITFICVFYNICAAAATDLLFDYKVGHLCKINFNRIYKYQWLGLIVTSLSIGFFFWILFTNLQLGSAELFAQRAKSRALLIQSLNFDFYVVGLGFIYGWILKKLKFNPTMVFGGLLMPNTITIGLAIGAVISYFSKKTQTETSFWSGVFASESLWILLTIILKMF
ncbi:MAG: OPT/YSL family transporter [bacterium]